jgi:hypothetical protein
MGGTIHAFQIYYNEPTRLSLDPDFEPLDNLANERPDWYEYWPIRRFFEANPVLDEDAYYGFFSPQFFNKTLLRGRQVIDFARQAGDADVITFSPFPCHGAVYYNVFEHGANAFPGFLDASTQFLRHLDPEFRPEAVINDSRDTVYCNFFLAKPRFWNGWLRIFNRAFDLAENDRTGLGEVLRRPISYAGKPTEMKIMVLERMASFLLASGAFSIRNYPPFSMPLTAQFGGRLQEVQALDRLKIAYREGGDGQLMRDFLERRNALLAAVRITENLNQRPRSQAPSGHAG